MDTATPGCLGTDTRGHSVLILRPRYTGFRDLFVINEDYVAPGMGFGTHGHRDMEIISYVVEGQLAHKDSTGVLKNAMADGNKD